LLSPAILWLGWIASREGVLAKARFNFWPYCFSDVYAPPGAAYIAAMVKSLRLAQPPMPLV